MKLALWLAITLILVVAVISWFTARNKYAVKDSNGDVVKGKFVSENGTTATLKA